MSMNYFTSFFFLHVVADGVSYFSFLKLNEKVYEKPNKPKLSSFYVTSHSITPSTPIIWLRFFFFFIPHSLKKIGEIT